MNAKGTVGNPHSFTEAVAYLSEGHGIDYEVVIGRHHGALLPRAEWLECVCSGFFRDYDGYGDQVDAAGTIIEEHIRPSTAYKMLPSTAYILWYNR